LKENSDYALPEFSTFERFATEWLPQQNPQEVDFVLQSQSKFVCDGGGNVLVPNLIMLPDLADQWKIMIKDLNCASRDLPIRNQMDKKNKVENVSPAAIAAIAKFYRTDFELIDRVLTKGEHKS
jgi:hypothetical protein